MAKLCVLSNILFWSSVRIFLLKSSWRNHNFKYWLSFVYVFICSLNFEHWTLSNLIEWVSYGKSAFKWVITSGSDLKEKRSWQKTRIKYCLNMKLKVMVFCTSVSVLYLSLLWFPQSTIGALNNNRRRHGWTTWMYIHGQFKR